MTRETSGTTRRRLLGALGGAGVAGAAGVGSAARGAPTGHAVGGSWPLFQYDRRNSGVNRRASGPRDAVGTRWAAGIGRVGTPPVLDGDTAYVADVGRGAVHAFDRASGRRRWSTSIDATSARMALDGDTLYVPGRSLYALDAATGDRRWSAGTSIYYAVVVREGFAYVAGQSGIEAIDPGTRNVLWRSGTERVVDSAHAFGPERLFAVGTDDGKARAIDPGSGSTIWERLLGTSPQGEPALANGTLLVPGESGLIAVDTVAGSISWTADVRPRGSPVVADGTVYGNSADGGLFAVDLASGEQRWRRGSVTSTNAPVMAGGALYVAADDGTVAAVEPSDGSVRWQRTFDGEFVAAPAVAGGELVVPGTSSLHTFSADATTPTATPTDAETPTPTDTSSAADSPTPTDTPDEDDGSSGGSDGGGGGLVVALVVAVVLLLGGGGAAALLGLDTIREALGMTEEGADEDAGPEQ